MHLVYSQEDCPASFSKSIFLAGPTPVLSAVKSWRPEILEILRKKGYDGVVFVPENRGGICGELDDAAYLKQVEWEHLGLRRADCIIFWVPRDLDTLPGFTTNVEFGLWGNSRKVVLGAPKDARKMRYLKTVGNKFLIPQADNLEDVVDAALAMIGEGASRSGGERDIPIQIWRMPSFQSWYQAQEAVGNRLEVAEVEWVRFGGPQKKFIVAFAIHVDLYVAEEKRHKSNETVIFRSDISSVIMYKRAANLMDTKIVLVREFRSPAATADGFIWELPSGSSFKQNRNQLEVAAEEVKEETGLEIDWRRLKAHGARQLAGTLSAHKAHVFSLELTDEELGWLENQAGIAHGAGDEGETGERTYVVVRTLKEVMSDHLADWTTIGIILSVVRP